MRMRGAMAACVEHFSLSAIWGSVPLTGQAARKPRANQAAMRGAAGKIDLDALALPAEALGALFGVSRKWVEKLAEDGVIARAAKGRYPIGPAVRGYIAWLKSDQRRSSKTAADGRLRDARAREIELRIAERKRELVETDEAIATLDEIVGKMRGGQQDAPRRL